MELKNIENEVREYWETQEIKKEINEKLKENKILGYVEGPPTMNGDPHIGHIRGRIFKDLWYRFQILKGLNVVFRAGWDTQGLPVELQAEKELGLTGNKSENLEKIGAEKLVATCKELINSYNKKWVEVDSLLGMSLDYKRSYWTYKDEYIEREWNYLKKANERGLLDEGYRVVAFCPSCQTSLSHAEVSQGYETVEDPSVYFKMKLCDEDAFLILWTTMPFTVITDQMVGVNPKSDYCYIENNNEKWIIAKERIKELLVELEIENVKIIKTIKGKSLEGKKYIHPLLNQISGQAEIANEENTHIVVSEEFVDISTGTGLVHMAPANGEEDFEVAKRRNMKIFNPIDEKLNFTEDSGIFSGMFVRDADLKVIEELRKVEALVKESKITHEYPTCWRTRHRLVWITKREYFYWVDRLKDLAVKAAEGVEYFYTPPKNRFLEMVKEKIPWCISRDRIWGTPLPIWVCEDCKNKEYVFSRKEIIKKAIELPDGENFELHRPWIDRIKLTCSKCNGISHREKFVLDTWHNSGAAPYASFNDEEYNKIIPATFLTEGIDQTRGWAYTLLILNVILTGKASSPYDRFLFQGHVLDENGNKMSKSLGNIINGEELLQKNSVDLVRFYLIWKSSPIDSLYFSYSEMSGRPYQIINTIYNLHTYRIQNSKLDSYKEDEHTIKWALENNLLLESDKWILSRLQRTIKKVTTSLEESKYHESARTIENFVINELSHNYVPMTRSEIWEDSEENIERRRAIYSVLVESLKTICLLMHPIAPYISDHLYRNNYANTENNIILEEWPKINPVFENKELEDEMETVWKIISISNAARMKAKIKRRWPISEVLVFTPNNKEVKKHVETIQKVLNVKEVKFIEDIKDVPRSVKISINRKLVGPKFKKELSEIINSINNIDSEKALEELEKENQIKLEIKGKIINLEKQEIEIENIPKEGYEVSERDGLITAISTKRDSDLIADGMMKDIARRIQSLRKEKGFKPTDLVESVLISGLEKEWEDLMNTRKDEIAFLVRAKEIKFDGEKVETNKMNEVNIDGKKIMILIE